MAHEIEEHLVLAYALGELHGNELQRVREAIAESEELQALLREFIGLTVDIEAEMENEQRRPEHRMAREQYNVIESEIQRQEFKRSRRPWRFALLTIAAALTFLLVASAVIRKMVRDERSRKMIASGMNDNGENRVKPARRWLCELGDEGPDTHSTFVSGKSLLLPLSLRSEGYREVKQTIESGKWPTTDQVRTEELLNALTPMDERNDHLVSLNHELSPCPWNQKHLLLRLTVRTQTQPVGLRAPANIVFLVDNSDSMKATTRLPLFKRAFDDLLKRLGRHDSVAIITYGGSDDVILEPTVCNRRVEILRVVSKLKIADSEGNADGLVTAYGIAKGMYKPDRLNRVALCTDGDFNVAPRLEETVLEGLRGGIELQVVGFSVERLRDERFQDLVDQNIVHFSAVTRAAEADNAMRGLVRTAATPVALDPRFAIKLANVRQYRVIGHEQARRSSRSFVGKLMRGNAVSTTLVELIPGDEKPAVNAELLFEDVQRGRQKVTLSVEPESRIRAESRLTAAAAEFGMILRDGPHKGIASLDHILELIGDPKPGTKAAEFKDLVELAKQLKR